MGDNGIIPHFFVLRLYWEFCIKQKTVWRKRAIILGRVERRISQTNTNTLNTYQYHTISQRRFHWINNILFVIFTYCHQTTFIHLTITIWYPWTLLSGLNRGVKRCVNLKEQKTQFGGENLIFFCYLFLSYPSKRIQYNHPSPTSCLHQVSTTTFQSLFQTEPQRDREATQGQDEPVHHGAVVHGADVPRHVAQAGQADRAAHGGATPQDHPRSSPLLHRGTLQTLLPLRPGAQATHTSGAQVQNKSLLK